MNALAPKHPIDHLIGKWLIRLWAVAASLWGTFLLYRLGSFFWQARLILVRRPFGLLPVPAMLAVCVVGSIWISWTGLGALHRLGARSVKRLVILTAWLLWYLLCTLSGTMLAQIPFPRTISTVILFFPLYIIVAALVALCFCRAAYAQLKIRGPLSEEERDKMPAGIGPYTLAAWCGLLGSYIRCEIPQIYGNPYLYLTALTDSEAIVIGSAIATGIYFLLKIPLVREEPKRKRGHGEGIS